MGRKKKEKKQTIKSRIFNIMQYEKHPITGEILLTEETIKKVLEERKSFKQKAYIKHDKDVVVEQNQKWYNERLKEYNKDLKDVLKKKEDAEKFAGVDMTIATEEELIEKIAIKKKESPYYKNKTIEELKEDTRFKRKVVLDELDDVKNKIRLLNENPKELGDKKPAHFHIVLKSNVPLEISTVASWFGIPEQYVEYPKGRGAFNDCVAYLTHEFQPEKTIYDRSEVYFDGFDFEKLMKDYVDGLRPSDFTDKDLMLFEVLKKGKTLRDCEREDLKLYIDNYDKLKHFRMEYINNIAEMPNTRINYYICGRGGSGKDVMSMALARSLYPHIENDKDIFFTVGGNNVPFEGYDGQPVIIWSDCRSYELYEIFNHNRGYIFKAFDTHPQDIKFNVKFGSIKLINEVNIINSVQDYKEFLNNLAGEYTDKKGNQYFAEDKRQSYRRFPFIIPIATETFDLLINKGFYHDNGNFEEYIWIKNLDWDIRKLIPKYNEDKGVLIENERDTLKKVLDTHYQIVSKEQGIEINKEEFEEYGELEIINLGSEKSVVADTDYTKIIYKQSKTIEILQDMYTKKEWQYKKLENLIGAKTDIIENLRQDISNLNTEKNDFLNEIDNRDLKIEELKKQIAELTKQLNEKK